MSTVSRYVFRLPFCNIIIKKNFFPIYILTVWYWIENTIQIQFQYNSPFRGKKKISRFVTLFNFSRFSWANPVLHFQSKSRFTFSIEVSFQFNLRCAEQSIMKIHARNLSNWKSNWKKQSKSCWSRLNRWNLWCNLVISLSFHNLSRQ